MRASRIDIFSDGGGPLRIGITDDGSGMTHGDLALKQTLALASAISTFALWQQTDFGWRWKAVL